VEIDVLCDRYNPSIAHEPIAPGNGLALSANTGMRAFGRQQRGVAQAI